MTGDVLRRLREAYGFPADKVASRAGMTVAGFKTIERDGTSYGKTHVYGGEVFRGALNRKQRNFRRVLDALRMLKKRGGR